MRELIKVREGEGSIVINKKEEGKEEVGKFTEGGREVSHGQVAGGLPLLLLLASERVGRLPWLTGSTLGVSLSLGAAAAWLAGSLAGWGLVLMMPPAPSPYAFVVSQHSEAE